MLTESGPHRARHNLMRAALHREAYRHASPVPARDQGRATALEIIGVCAQVAAVCVAVQARLATAVRDEAPDLAVVVRAQLGSPSGLATSVVSRIVAVHGRLRLCVVAPVVAFALTHSDSDRTLGLGAVHDEEGRPGLWDHTLARVVSSSMISPAVDSATSLVSCESAAKRPTLLTCPANGPPWLSPT